MLTRFLVLAAALSSASAASARYAGVPAATVEETRVISRDTVWACGSAGCTARDSNARPAIVCAGLVREVGALTRFAVDGTAFTSEQLDTCNRRARQNARAAAPANQASAN